VAPRTLGFRGAVRATNKVTLAESSGQTIVIRAGRARRLSVELSRAYGAAALASRMHSEALDLKGGRS